jgi:RNA polymerase sigma-70 factor (ECF subfamily)
LPENITISALNKYSPSLLTSPKLINSNKETIVEDEEVLKRIKNGDTNAYSEIVHKYHRHLLNFIYAYVGDERIVEDIGQDTFISAFKSIANFDLSRGTPFSAWLFTIAKNRCASAYRHNKRVSLISLNEISDLPDTIQRPDTKLIYKENFELISAALEQLPEPFKSTLIDNIKGKCLEEIAISKNIAIGTVKSRLSRARDRLKNILGIKSSGRTDYETI